MYDPYFDGPKKERVRTDVSFMIILTIIIISWMGIGFWGKINSKSYGIIFNLIRCAITEFFSQQLLQVTSLPKFPMLL